MMIKTAHVHPRFGVHSLKDLSSPRLGGFMTSRVFKMLQGRRSLKPASAEDVKSGAWLRIMAPDLQPSIRRRRRKKERRSEAALAPWEDVEAVLGPRKT